MTMDLLDVLVPGHECRAHDPSLSLGMTKERSLGVTTGISRALTP
jgi:hypothetical protein